MLGATPLNAREAVAGLMTEFKTAVGTLPVIVREAEAGTSIVFTRTFGAEGGNSVVYELLDSSV